MYSKRNRRTEMFVLCCGSIFGEDQPCSAIVVAHPSDLKFDSVRVGRTGTAGGDASGGRVPRPFRQNRGEPWTIWISGDGTWSERTRRHVLIALLFFLLSGVPFGIRRL